MSLKWQENTHINRHLIHMNALLDSELGYQYIKGSIENIDNFGLADDRTIAMGQIGYENAEEKVG